MTKWEGSEQRWIQTKTEAQRCEENIFGEKNMDSPEQRDNTIKKRWQTLLFVKNMSSVKKKFLNCYLENQGNKALCKKALPKHGES